MIKNVLITGGAGFIGSNIAIKLLNKGYNVRVLDNLSPQVHGDNAVVPNAIYGKVDFIKGDIRNENDWKRAIENMDAIVHLAAETGTGQSMYEIYHYCDTNVCGTAKMLDILTNEKHSIKKVIVAASRAIYGEGMYKCVDHGIVYPIARKDEDLLNGDFEVKCPICGLNAFVIPTNEAALLHPSSVYGITKQIEEELVMTICKDLGINVISYRYQNVYGPGQSLNNPYTGILSIFSTRILNGKRINVFEDGQESRDFVYVDDVANATIAGLENENLTYESFNIGSGKMTTVNEVVKLLEHYYGKKADVVVSGNYRLGDIRHNYADISRAKILLNYDPKVCFEVGIKKFCEWVIKQNILADNYEKSLEEMKQKGLFK